MSEQRLESTWIAEEAWLAGELSGLAAASLEFADLAQAALELIGGTIPFPYVSISMRLDGHVEHYGRVVREIDPGWAADVEAQIVELQTHQLMRGTGNPPAPPVEYLATPRAWIGSFTGELRSGRGAALTVADRRPLQVDSSDGSALARLARHTLLLLDHALILQQLESVEVTDAMTGTLSQRRLLESLEYELQRHRHYDRRLAIVVVDVEGLDNINQSYGRRYGNHVLQKLAGLLQSAVRPVDLVSRYGLDEFAVVMPETDEEEGRALAEQLQDHLLSVEFAGGSVGVSIGVAGAAPDETLTADGLLRRGENALQEAKRQDRDLTALWHPDAPRAVR